MSRVALKVLEVPCGLIQGRLRVDITRYRLKAFARGAYPDFSGFFGTVGLLAPIRPVDCRLVESACPTSGEEDLM